MATWIGVMLLLTIPAAPAQQRLASAVVHPFGDEDPDVRAIVSGRVGLPPNVTVPSSFADLVDAMLRSSPTFRAQCSRIGRAGRLHVTVERSLSASPQAAVTHLTRLDNGRLQAEVELGLFGDPVLLIAHEFEHIIEQLDGVDLGAMADRSGTGVRADSRTGQFETERAIAIGKRVAREVSGAVARR